MLGSFALLVLGGIYGILSPGAMMIGWVAWVATFTLLAFVRQLTAKKHFASSMAPEIVIDARTRRHIRRKIWINKVWIGLLAMCLPLGIAKGATEHLWGPLSVGLGINLAFMYSAVRQIRRQRERLNSTRG